MNPRFIIALFLFWVVLSATFHPAYLITGAIAVGVIAWINAPSKKQKSGFSLVSALMYGPWLSLRVLKSSIHVCKLILHPKLPVNPQLHKHKTQLNTDSALTVLGNSITLTPGTITIEIEPGEVLVHSLDEDSLSDIRSGDLERKVDALFTRNQKDDA